MLSLEDLGRAPYPEVWDRQRALAEARAQDLIPDTLILVEHDPVYTLGRRRGAAQNVLFAGEVPVIQVERGGDVTYHGPGQIVVYPIVYLPEGRRDLIRHLRTLEEAAIRTCAEFGLLGERDPRNSGAWVRGRKIASVGVACRRWVTSHGLALNVAPDMSYFQRINPCGLGSEVMTSMQLELGQAPAQPEVAARLVAHLQDLFA